MREIFRWLRNLTGYFVFLSVLRQLIPEKSYGNYIRFFAGVVLILLVISPFADKTQIPEQIARVFQELQFQDEAEELKREIQGAEKIQLTRLIENYESAIARDIAGIAGKDGYEVKNCQVTISDEESGENFGQVTRVILRLQTNEKDRDEYRRILRKKISSDYSLEESNVEIQITERER